jgi:hypothetical protein
VHPLSGKLWLATLFEFKTALKMIGKQISIAKVKSKEYIKFLGTYGKRCIMPYQGIWLHKHIFFAQNDNPMYRSFPPDIGKTLRKISVFSLFSNIFVPNLLNFRTIIIKMLALVLLGLSVSASPMFKEGFVEGMLNGSVEGPGGANVVVDISAYQPNVDFNSVYSSGIRAVIHRASQ